MFQTGRLNQRFGVSSNKNNRLHKYETTSENAPVLQSTCTIQSHEPRKLIMFSTKAFIALALRK